MRTNLFSDKSWRKSKELSIINLTSDVTCPFENTIMVNVNFLYIMNYYIEISFLRIYLLRLIMKMNFCSFETKIDYFLEVFERSVICFANFWKRLTENKFFLCLKMNMYIRIVISVVQYLFRKMCRKTCKKSLKN